VDSTLRFPVGFSSAPLKAGLDDGTCIERDVLVLDGPGPAVIVIHEAPALTESTLELARLLGSLGYTVVLPVLLGPPRVKASIGQTLRGLATICVAREFHALARNETSPIVAWLSALAVREHAFARGPGVGVIGMCFSGGFALAMVREENVVASVVGQPALPFTVLPGSRRALGLSAGDLDCIRGRAAMGFSVRAHRFRADLKSPGARLRELQKQLPNAQVHEIPSCNPMRHSVLASAVDAAAGSTLAEELAATIEYLEARLPHEPTERELNASRYSTTAACP
jgi:dienelactone hydrolase